MEEMIFDGEDDFILLKTVRVSFVEFVKFPFPLFLFEVSLINGVEFGNVQKPHCRSLPLLRVLCWLFVVGELLLVG